MRGILFAILVAGLLTPALPASADQGMKNKVKMQQVSPDQLQHAILQYAKAQSDETIADVQVQVIDPVEPLSIPAGALTSRVTLSEPADGYGRRTFDLALAVNGKWVKTVKATADVLALVDAVTANRLIRTDDLIQSEDVTITRVPLSVAPRQFVTDLQTVIGKRALRTFPPHAPLIASAVGQPYAVRKGDRVTIEARRGRLLIQTIGITKAVGQIGQVVTVTNQDSGKDIRAKVVGPGVVQVEF